MSVGSRFFNFIRGIFWLGQKNLEQTNPEAVYESAIRKSKENYQRMQEAVGRLAAERNRLRSQIEKKSKVLAEVEGELEGALLEAEHGNTEAMEVGEELIAEQEQLRGELATLKGELTRSETVVSEYLAKLRFIEGKTKELESRKDAMIAKLRSAEARKSFSDMMSDMSTGAEESAVGDIERHIESVAAQADIGDEMSGATREEKRRKLREAAASRKASSKFQQMLEARKATSGSSGDGADGQTATNKSGI